MKLGSVCLSERAKYLLVFPKGPETWTMALPPDDQQSQHPRHVNVEIRRRYHHCRNYMLWRGEPRPKCWQMLILKRSLRKQTNTCFILSYSVETIFHLRVLGPFLNTVCQFFIMHYLNTSGRTLRGFTRGNLWECYYENNLSRFNLSSLGSRREAACSKLFNNMCIPSHKLHHLVLQRQTNPDINSGNQVRLMFLGVYVELRRCS